MKPTKEDVKNWTTALRSGNYKQTEGMLNNGSGYCCLGVACDLFIPHTRIKRNTRGYIVGASPDCQPNSPEWLKLVDKHILDTYGTRITDLNDSGLSFGEIADIIEQVYLGE